jgi:hypothetical protein
MFSNVQLKRESLLLVKSISNTRASQFAQGAILADPNDIDVRTMSRSSSPGELLFGPLQFTCFMMWVGIEFFMTAEGAILVAALGIGDGIAPIIGEFIIPRRKIKILNHFRISDTGK